MRFRGNGTASGSFALRGFLGLGLPFPFPSPFSRDVEILGFLPGFFRSFGGGAAGGTPVADVSFATCADGEAARECGGDERSALDDCEGAILLC